MSRRSLQFRRLAASGPLVEVRSAEGYPYVVRARKNRESFERALPKGMRPSKRERILAREYPSKA